MIGGRRRAPVLERASVDTLANAPGFEKNLETVLDDGFPPDHTPISVRRAHIGNTGAVIAPAHTSKCLLQAKRTVRARTEMPMRQIAQAE